MAAEVRHANAIAENAAARARAGGVNGQHRNFVTGVAEPRAKGFEQGAFAGAGYTADADAPAFAGIGQELFDDLAGADDMIAVVAFDEADCPRQRRAVTAADAFHEICGTGLRTGTALMGCRRFHFG